MLFASHASGGFVFRPRMLPFVVLLAALVAWCLPTAANADEPLPKGTLSGSVVDADDRPVAGARVWSTTWDSKLLMEAFTGADGRFRIGPVDPVYRCRNDLWIDAEGFARQYVLRQTYSVFPGANSEIGAIRLDRGCVFTGQILDADGKPMAGAVVECQVYHHELGHTIVNIGPATKIETDAQGRFRTPPMGIGERSIYVRAPQHRLLSIEPPDDPVGEIALDPRRMEPDVPIFGSISDELGRPIAGARIHASDVDETTSDSEGRFVLSGFESEPRFQLQASKDGYVFINWGVKGGAEGFHWHEVMGDGTEHGPMRELKVTMHPLAWIEGQAVDEATNEPVRLEKVVLCFFERKPNGEIVLGGCRASDFEQPKDGHFRVPYSQPSEYHVSFVAPGYHDAEAFTPKVATLEAIGGLVVRMRKKAASSKGSVAHQTISGMVSDRGKPLTTGWVGLWTPHRRENAVNTFVMRRRTTVGWQIVYDSAPIRDGKYSLDVPFQGEEFYVVAEAPGIAPTIVGPLAVALDERKTIDISCVEGGGIRGRVEQPPAAWRNDLWVVAFTESCFRTETRVGPDGVFSFPQLPPGRYGLKVGHDAYKDSEVLDGAVSQEVWDTPLDPWKRATTVNVEQRQVTDDVVLRLPDD